MHNFPLAGIYVLAGIGYTSFKYVIAQAESLDPGLLGPIMDGGMGAILLVVLYFTYKYFQKNQSQLIESFHNREQNILNQHKEQIKDLLYQTASQYEKALEQQNRQHKDDLDESRRILDQVFKMMDKDNEAKIQLHSVLQEIKDKLKN